MDYKKRIMLLDLSRKVLAPRLKLSYAALTARLNGFTPFQPDEERALVRILDEAEQAHAAIEQARDKRVEPYYAR
jgi:hypothetical protein